MAPLSVYLLLSPCFLFQIKSEGNSQSDGSTAAAEDDQALVVRCHQESIEVVMRTRLFGRPTDVVGLGLGAAGSRCSAELLVNGDFIIRAPLAECGSRLMVESEVLYINLLLVSLTPSAGDAAQVEAAAVPVMCKYRRRLSVSSGALRPTWTPQISVQSAHLSLDFQLRLMTDDWSRQRTSPVYSMDQTVNIQASLDHHPPPRLRLYAGSCVATLTPDVNSHPRYPFIDHQGCFTDSQLSASSSRFLPRVRDELLQIQLQPFLFHQDRRHTIYITCYLEAVPVFRKDPEKKACSFINGRWRSADVGDDGGCEICEATPGSSVESSHKRAQRSKGPHGNELHRENTLGPIVFLPE